MLGANVREGATRRAEEPVTPQGPGLSSGTRKGEGGRVRSLAYLALIENDQSSVESRICEMRYVGNPRGVSSIRVFVKALGRASLRTSM